VSFATIAALGAIGVVATLASRAVSRLHAGKLRHAEEARKVGPDGVVIGAEGVHIAGSSDRCALLLHGFNDTPQSLLLLGRSLHARGWTISIPLLPHHGRGSSEFMKGGNAAEWIECARREWSAFASSSPTPVLIGQSMGGAIAAILSVERPPAALVLLAPYLRMGWPERTLARVWPVWQFFVPELRSNPGRALRDAEARAASRGGMRFSPRLVAELLRVVQQAWRALPQMTAPTLVFHARSDYRIPSKAARAAFERIGSADKTLVWNTKGGHVVAADEGREEVIANVVKWLDTRAVDARVLGARVLDASPAGNTFDTI
jgi:carboxylesterase